MDQFDVPVSDDGKIIDFIDGGLLEPHPEEFVRQHYLRVLHYEYQYPKALLAREIPIQYGSKELVDIEGRPVRADIVIYKTASAAKTRDQGAINLVVECKSPTELTGYSQLVSYIFNTSANGGAWFNGETIRYFRRLTSPSNELIEWTGIPRPGEAWDALGRRKKSDLVRPKDIRGLLRRCHNKLHGRGVDGDEEDLTMDMVRLILAKAMDEEGSGELPEFYCTPEEYLSSAGQSAVAARVSNLFEKVVSANPDVFSQYEKISVGPRTICDVVVELQRYRLLSDLQESDDWDIMGYAYEQYTATYLKRTRGQFFTNRLVVDLMVAITDPDYQDIILDPAGGSGGFLTGAMRHVRRKILSGTGTKISKQRQLDRHRTKMFMVEVSRRLVKIAKTAMILNGDGHTGMTHGDSLGPYEDLNETILAMASRHKPAVILTNPPFAGVGEGRITDAKVLSRYRCGHRWATVNGVYAQTSELLSEGAPPEMLFFEKITDWLAPGGRVGIVMPKSFLDTQTYLAARKILLTECRLLAVVNCHKNTFQPHTGVRTCLVFFEKLKANEKVPADYSILMAISKKIGQDSEGVPIFKRDNENNLTDQLDHDLGEILADFQLHRSAQLKPSEYRFSVQRSTIDELLRINPQVYLPNLNATIKAIEEIDGRDGWSVSTIGQLAPDIRIFKGPRLKSENLIVERAEKPTVEPYYTPSAVLQEKSDSVKLLDVGRATAKQLKTINAVRVKRGDIVVTRSGTIGRVAIITNRLDGAIVSDDLIRVRVSDDRHRLYVLAYLMSRAALDQMLRNEYGAVQQHLEPSHISDILIPVPDDWAQVDTVIKATAALIGQKEALEEGSARVQALTEKLLLNLRED